MYIFWKYITYNPADIPFSLIFYVKLTFYAHKLSPALHENILLPSIKLI